ncbi:hypothetical protein [Singulisphaera acidiphila]|uniref:Uncharacterized protein n=1 Tax=Singulisphaera acidiphila (strain ATCC BAA-1392 / DSM 18658 / VKM B-2454 / MOB10) TaxID=886293 RepID=L0DFL5_SINAD|nr:hypothetical protein [Singulisphaera acidiphila]AGA27650.1 hypothetical protein Sinac_3389 [Singulisphaera acidiphila DSM 18658]
MPRIIDTHKPGFLPSDDPSRDRLDDPLGSKLPQDWDDRKATARAYRASQARATGTRRRSVDPCTSELDYSPAQLEFMLAMQAYKQASGRMFPTWSETLEVLTKLGYEKSLKPTVPGTK